MYKIGPAIDTKVCNKKVAVDDSYTRQPTHRRGDTAATRADGVVKDSSWSCVDYVDAPGERTGSGKQEFGRRPEGRALSIRFRSASDAAFKAEDGPGTCYEQETNNWIVRPVKKCGEGAHSVMVLGGDADGPWASNKWYTEKQTNRGWPGTAEGRINTAQGMAGDLVSNLDSEEKSAVAGIGLSHLQICRFYCVLFQQY